MRARRLMAFADPAARHFFVALPPATDPKYAQHHPDNCQRCGRSWEDDVHFGPAAVSESIDPAEFTPRTS